MELTKQVLQAKQGDRDAFIRLVFDGGYATTGKTKYLIIKPFVYQDDFSEKVRDDQFVKGLELKMELPAQNE
ncbi:hypothetical protein AN963_29690 [Brevibacillus choshinensis]|uniref:Uncharacterized protein n=1 Tax=Brevibacillus choshinensis TaxID=54911 RepID=A0ABR5N0F7_BRECH|nr:hypothetical protein [Brevibacillus choshinensis]KQL43609.1 hypothetical protein AN963_29690 [Brevibacillus choshinensis]